MGKKHSLLIIALLFIAAAFGLKALFFDGQKSSGKIIFEDVSLASGISYQGMTFGGSWGDFNGDGLPDLYLPNHGNPGMLFQNRGAGHFENVTDSYFTTGQLQGDEHGAAWADYDNDGDQDLVVLHGGGRGVGTGPNRFYRNVDGRFDELAAQNGSSNPYARTRSPLWYDFNQDGKLDLFLGALERADGKAPGAIFLQNNSGQFIEAENLAPFASASVPFCIIGELDSKQGGELVCRVKGAKNRTGHVLTTAVAPMAELDLLPVSHFEDVAVADFNGDGLMDAFLARRAAEKSVLLGQRGSNVLFADLRVTRKTVGDAIGFSFYSHGDLHFEVSPEYPSGSLAPGAIFLGNDGIHPGGLSFTVSRETAGIAGMRAIQFGEQVGLYVGFTAPDQWHVLFSSSSKLIADSPEKNQRLALSVASTQPITKMQISEGGEQSPQAEDRLLINHSGKMEREGRKRGINAMLTASQNVVAGDFDNDMDIDLYVVASGPVANESNVLYLNNGRGEFISAPLAGGASGGVSGVGDAVAMADFDQDGFLDLLIANGGSMGRSYGLAAQEGGYRLYRNVGNENNWLEIDLEGVATNRDGIGAKVYVTVGDKVQMRLQDAGSHSRAQNHQRLHFGLAVHQRVDEVKVIWPGGNTQVIKDIAVNQIIKIRESVENAHD